MFQVVQQICRCFVEIFKEFMKFKLDILENLRRSWVRGRPLRAAQGSKRNQEIKVILGSSEPYILNELNILIKS